MINKFNTSALMILSNNGSKIPLIVFRGAIKSNEFAEKLFKSFEVKE